MTKAPPRRVLVIGGTGVFGKRLVRHLARSPTLEVLVASRKEANALAVIADVVAEVPCANLRSVELDHRQNLSSVLAELQPSIVIDCSGPFQSADFEVARTVLGSSAHLIDLADARNYLMNYPAELDALAKRNQKTGVAGASSTPALSACVVKELTKGWRRVDTVDICIAPGGKSEVGRSVIEAIMSYAGRDVPIWRNEKLGTITGWASSWTLTVPDLGRRRVAPVETLDAELLGPRHNVQSRVSFTAGLESLLEQLGLQTLAWLRRLDLLPNLKPLIPLLLRLRSFTRIFNSDVGGMLVEASGINEDGVFTQSRWTLLARQGHGPVIPVLPAAAAVRRLQEGSMEEGAFLACDQLELSDILEETKPYAIEAHTQIDHADTGIFQTKLSLDAFIRLPDSLQAFHRITGAPVWSGKADVEEGRWFGPKLLARIFGFPSGGTDIPVTVNVDRSICSNGIQSERWTRNFGGCAFSSSLTHYHDGMFEERFGLFSFALGLSVDADGITMPIHGWRCGKVPLPIFLAPKSEAREYEDSEGRFCFDVRLTVPFMGLLAHYRGWLVPEI